ncbi:MAG: protein kinase, partial [Acidobacteriota bacterium]
MGEVYRAYDESLDRPVAIKLIRQSVLRRHPAGLGEVRQRFRREAQSAARLNHPAIIQVYHVVETPFGDALVMELVDGRSLSDLIAEGPIAADRVASIGCQIALGLAEAHSKGIVHRDLKPANVMVDDENRVKILDFGLAKAFEANDGGQSSGVQVLTDAGYLVGSYDTMSPEQARGEPIGPTSDLFSLGTLLYTLLAGRRPFWGKSPMATLTQICVDAHPPIATRVRGVPDAMVDLVDRLLAKEPEGRPPDAATVAAALDGLMIEQHPLDESVASVHPESTSPMRALVGIDLLGREASWEELGEGPAARLLARHDSTVSSLVQGYDGEEAEAEEGHLLLFPRPAHAVHFALDYQHFLDTLVADHDFELEGRVAIHFGEPTVESVESDVAEPDNDEVTRVTGTARTVLDGVLALASPGQILITRGAFDLARDAALERDEAIAWMAHGDYLIEGLIGSVGLYEVGLEGRAPLAPPLSTRATEALVVDSRETILGWRPAVGQQVPGREHWVLERHLGGGGFGEVWLVRHSGTHEVRVFKFCFEAERLRALQNEIAIFRLLKEELGERHDIARILDWRLDEAPYFVEAEYTEGGSLDTWLTALGGVEQVPLDIRLDLVAQVAEALAAAHSVGVLHKDVKPGNILVYLDAEGRPRARLADFGISAVTDKDRLRRAGITVAAGLTRNESGSDGAGTRLYQAPEVLEGKASTVHCDVYALGVVLYQLVVGDLASALGSGWERRVDDELLREDIAAAVDLEAVRRIEPLALAENLRQLEARRRRRAAEQREREAAERLRLELDRTRGRRRLWATVALVALVFGGVMAWQTVRAEREAARANREAETARQVSTFLEEIFTDANPWASEPGVEPTVRELVDRGAERLSTELADQPLVRARLLNAIVEVYYGLGDVPRAAEMAERARVALEDDHAESHEMVEALRR